MDCTLKIISGPESGQEVICGSGESFMGRSQRCTVRLASPSVSYEHAVITRTGDDYFIENLSANGTFVNGDRITGKTRLRTKDQIALGQETTVRVVSLPAAAGAGSSRRVLVTLIVIMLVIGVALIALDPFSGASTTEWPKAYNALQDFVQKQAAARALPQESADMLREAWRLETAGDRERAGQAWVRLHVLLTGTGDKYGIEEAAAKNRKALLHMLSPPTKDFESSDDDLKAALLQFVVQMERRK